MRFYKAVARAYTRWRRDQNIMQVKNEIFVRKGAALIKLHYEEIYWIEAMENYVLLNTSKEKLTVHFTLKAISERLPDELFQQVHRSYIINIQHITLIRNNHLLLHNRMENKKIPIGKSYRDKLLSSINLMSH